jgi:hypothetical protein
MTGQSNRRSFLTKLGSLVGISMLPLSVPAEILSSSKTVEFVTRFPNSMSLAEYRSHKAGFENKDKVTTLLAAFQASGQILSETFAFHGTSSSWTVQFRSESAYQEWMKLTEVLGSHLDQVRENAGFTLEIRSVG